MSALALISGSVFRLERKTSRNNNSYVQVVVKTVDGGEAVFWRVFVFDEDAQRELDTLGEGDGLSAVGRLSAEVYQPEGKAARVSFTLTADRLLVLRKAKPQRVQADREPSRGPMLLIEEHHHLSDDARRYLTEIEETRLRTNSIFTTDERLRLVQIAKGLPRDARSRLKLKLPLMSEKLSK